MTFYKKIDNKISIAKTIDLAMEQTVLQEASQYQLVKVSRITWERLDDDRTGSNFDVYYYSLAETSNCPVDFAIIVENHHFAGIALKYNTADSWPMSLSKRSIGNGCVLLVDGTTVGRNETVDVYDTPNDQDVVKTTYSLKKLD